MTVRTNESKIFFYVVIWISIDVIDFYWNFLSHPFCQFANFANDTTFRYQSRSSTSVLLKILEWYKWSATAGIDVI